MPPSCISLLTHQTLKLKKKKLRPRGTCVILSERVEKLQDDIWPYDPSMQHTVASYRHQQALFLKEENNWEAINCPSSHNATINQKWPLIMIMEEVMMVMEKVQENKNKWDPTCCDRKQISSATVSYSDVFTGHACCVATPPSMLCKPHSFKRSRCKWTAHDINDKNEQQHKHRQESAVKKETVCVRGTTAPCYSEARGVRVEHIQPSGKTFSGAETTRTNSFSLSDMEGKTEEKMVTVSKKKEEGGARVLSYLDFTSFHQCTMKLLSGPLCVCTWLECYKTEALRAEEKGKRGGGE